MRSASSACSREFANSENWVCMASELGIHATRIEHALRVHPLLQAAMQPQHGWLQGVERKIRMACGIARCMAPYGFRYFAHSLHVCISAQPALCTTPIY